MTIQKSIKEHSLLIGCFIVTFLILVVILGQFFISTWNDANCKDAIDYKFCVSNNWNDKLFIMILPIFMLMFLGAIFDFNLFSRTKTK